MKAFISHSWKNKMAAQQIADALKEAGVEIWLDANNLLPGQSITSTIDQALGSMDIVILVWSKQAMESDGVLAEIESSSRLKKLVLPCLLDDTSLDTHSYLKEIKGIGFADMQDGIGRLKIVLLNYMMAGFNMHQGDSAKKLNEFLGSLETAAYLTQTQNIKETGTEAEKDFWINKVTSTHSAAEQHLREEQEKGKQISEFLNEKMACLQVNLHNQQACNQILSEMKAFAHAQHPVMQSFIQRVQDICKSFKKDDPIEKYKQAIESKIPSSFQQLKTSFGWIIPESVFKSSFDNLSYFISSSAYCLQQLQWLSEQTNAHPVIGDCAAILIQYIQTPGGVIDNSQYGILGYADDAYLIHSLVTALQNEGVITTAGWNINWVTVNTGCTIAFSLIGANIKQQLDNDIAAFCQAMVNKYNPQHQQQQYDQLQKAKDDLWRAKLISLQGDLNR